MIRGGGIEGMELGIRGKEEEEEEEKASRTHGKLFGSPKPLDDTKTVERDCGEEKFG